jgi:hypothetical protein
MRRVLGLPPAVMLKEVRTPKCEVRTFGPRTSYFLLLLLGSAAALHAAYSFDFRCRSDTVQRIDTSGVAEFEFTITNIGNQPDGYQFDCRIVSGIPDWYVTYCVGGLCGSPGMVLDESLTVSDSDTTAHVMVYSSSTPGEEVVNLRIQSLGNPALIDSVTTHTLASAGVEELPPPWLPERISLSITPNPVSDRALISYTLPPGNVEARLALFDVQGRRWLTVTPPGSNPGRHELRWLRPGRLPDGVYLLGLRFGSQSVWRKVVLDR